MIRKEQILDLVRYEVCNHWLAPWIWFDWGQNVMASYFTWKVTRKYKNYLKFYSKLNS